MVVAYALWSCFPGYRYSQPIPCSFSSSCLGLLPLLLTLLDRSPYLARDSAPLPRPPPPVLLIGLQEARSQPWEGEHFPAGRLAKALGAGQSSPTRRSGAFQWIRC